MKIENFGTNWLDFELPFACDVHFSFPKPMQLDRFRVLLIACEPAPIRISDNELAAVWQQYDLIISHDASHLKYPNVKRLIFWDTYVNTLPPSKQFDISTIISIGGGPASMDGYKVREELYHRKGEITTPNRFFISRRLPNWENTGLPPLPDDKKDAMFTSMFHIAVENIIEQDYFSEKLLDCFNSFTVPIYRGCSNIAQHGIDERAMIRFDTTQECIDICNNLTLDDYYSRLTYITEAKKERARQGLWLAHVKQMILETWAAKQA